MQLIYATEKKLVQETGFERMTSSFLKEGLHTNPPVW